jgi:glycosyltransferase involved in cell wall biosynthesis
MKIIHIIFSLNIGGSENMLIDIINEQQNLGHDVEIIVINNDINKILTNNIHKNIKITKVNRPVGSKNIFYFIKLYAILYSRKGSIIHCHNSIMGEILKYYKRIKIITIHSTGASTKGLSNFNKIISISEAVKNDLKENGNYDSKVIINGVNCNNIKTKNSINNSDSYKLLQIGRLEDIKGQDISLNALNKLIKLGLNIKLVFIGTGSTEKKLKKLSSELKIEKNVEFLGAIPKEEIYKQINEYDILLQPSREEGFGLTIVEGMAAKVPVLVSDIPGPLEVILNEKIGTSFKSNDPESLSEKICYILNNNINIKTEKAYQYTIENYSIKNTVSNYINLYKELIK